MVEFKVRYYMSNNGRAFYKFEDAYIAYLDPKGNWIERSELITKFVGGDSNFGEISAEKAKGEVIARGGRWEEDDH